MEPCRPPRPEVYFSRAADASRLLKRAIELGDDRTRRLHIPFRCSCSRVRQAFRPLDHIDDVRARQALWTGPLVGMRRSSLHDERGTHPRPPQTKQCCSSRARAYLKQRRFLAVKAATGVAPRCRRNALAEHGDDVAAPQKPSGCPRRLWCPPGKSFTLRLRKGTSARKEVLTPRASPVSSCSYLHSLSWQTSRLPPRAERGARNRIVHRRTPAGDADAQGMISALENPTPPKMAVKAFTPAVEDQ